MSRLDSVIRRLMAQRSCLDQAVKLVGPVPGVVVELGLGNGRTFDHLREIMPEREIFVFERQINAHPASVPERRHLIIGDLRDTLPAAAGDFAGRVALLHSDIGSGNPQHDAEMTELLSRRVAPLLAPGALVVSDRALDIPQTIALPLPADVVERRYFMYRFSSGASSV